MEEERLKIGADLDILSELCKEHPPPYVRPIVHNIKHSVRRFFSGMYVWGDELLDKGNLHPVLSVPPEEDGRIVYCLPETHESANKLMNFAESCIRKFEGVVVVVPKAPLQVREVVTEISALRRLQKDQSLLSSDPLVFSELQQLVEAAQENLLRMMKRVVQPSDNSYWFPKLEPKFASDGGGVNT